MVADVQYDTLETPLGGLLAARDGKGITGLWWRTHARTPHAEPTGDDGAFGDLQQQLAEYLAGDRRTFDLPLAPHGTPWQHAVWDALHDIPYGATITYAELAARAGRPGAARAAGAANGRNPLSILVPCHRVVGGGGALTGYAGGLGAKRALLALEASA